MGVVKKQVTLEFYELGAHAWKKGSWEPKQRAATRQQGSFSEKNWVVGRVAFGRPTVGFNIPRFKIPVSRFLPLGRAP